MPEEVEGHIGLDEEDNPKVFRKGGFDTDEDGQEVGFEGIDGPFGGVVTVDVWGNELELSLPIFLDKYFLFGTGFVAKDVKVDVVTAGLESCHDGIVGGDAMCVLFGHKGGLKDGDGVAMVGNHNVLIDATR